MQQKCNLEVLDNWLSPARLAALRSSASVNGGRADRNRLLRALFNTIGGLFHHRRSHFPLINIQHLTFRQKGRKEIRFTVALKRAVAPDARWSLSLAGFQRRTYSPSLSPLPFAQEKAHPLATLRFLSLHVPTPLYLSFIKTFQAPKSFRNFSRHPPRPPSPSPIPDSAPPLLKTPSPSHSQSDHAWMRHGCATASSLPNWLAGVAPLLHPVLEPVWCWVR